ncbi:unnamed protein product, partial [Didymodactylos carnosus]
KVCNQDCSHRDYPEYPTLPCRSCSNHIEKTKILISSDYDTNNNIINDISSKSTTNICLAFNNHNEKEVIVNNCHKENVTSEQTTMMNAECTGIETRNVTAREKKLRERWTKHEYDSSQQQNESINRPQILLGLDFPPVAVLRRKFNNKNNSTITDNSTPINKKPSHIVKKITETTPLIQINTNINSSNNNHCQQVNDDSSEASSCTVTTSNDQNSNKEQPQ